MKAYIRTDLLTHVDGDKRDLIPRIKEWFTDRDYAYALTEDDYVYVDVFYYAIEMEDDVFIHLKLDGILHD
jgi:hypothetical protein